MRLLLSHGGDVLTLADWVESRLDYLSLVDFVFKFGKSIINYF